MTTHEDVTAPENDRPGGLLGLRIAAGVIIAFGLVALWRSWVIAPGTGFAVVGPRAFPLGVSIGLLVAGALFLAKVTLRPDRWLISKSADEDRDTHWPTPALLVTALVVYAVALAPLGYLVATSLFLPTSARILGSRELPRDVAVGIVVAVVLFFGFTTFLGLRLPAGILEPIL